MNVQKFAAAHLAELGGLASAILEEPAVEDGDVDAVSLYRRVALAVTTDKALVARHLRRRTTSHKSRRMPARLRYGVGAERKGSLGVPFSARCRKHRRRNSTL